MALLVSAKGSDILAWRASGDYSADFRQSLLARLKFCRSSEGEALLVETGLALDELLAANDAFCTRCTNLIEEVSDCTDLPRLKELTSVFFVGLYEHFDIYHSAPAFYQFSALFLQALSRSVCRHAQPILGLPDRRMPPVMLAAMGAAGRQEFSPFIPLQLILIHGESLDTDNKALSLLGRLIHECFESCGLQVDETVTPRNQDWRGSMSEWQERLAQRMDHGTMDGTAELSKLADQSTLYCDDGFSPDFNMLWKVSLRERRAVMVFQVTRLQNLSHGIGIMGGMRYEKKGPYRGLFALYENGLKPLSAAICVLAQLKSLEAPTTPQRIREILWRREMNVDMAERLLQAWHTLHELRLSCESVAKPDWSLKVPLYLDVEELPDSEQNSLRESLETVGAIQRQVGQTFNGMEG